MAANELQEFTLDQQCFLTLSLLNQPVLQKYLLTDHLRVQKVQVLACPRPDSFFTFRCTPTVSTSAAWLGFAGINRPRDIMLLPSSTSRLVGAMKSILWAYKKKRHMGLRESHVLVLSTAVTSSTLGVSTFGLWRGLAETMLYLFCLVGTVVHGCLR
jgi:hypothetical protein